MASDNGGTASTWILVVTDDPRVRDTAGSGFAEAVEVTFAADAREALEVLRLGIPAAMVVDIQSGSAGGYALCRDMAADPRLEAVPVMMLLDRDQDAWLAKEAGAKIHLTKPIDGSRLVDAALSLVAPVG